MVDIPFTLDQLRIIQAIASEGSFKKAAESLYISQPAVSLQIQNLEKQLNVTIFDRCNRKAKLTQAGQLLLGYSRRILPLCEETCHALEDLNNLQSGTLIIGASQTIGTYLMPRLIGLFRQRYPNVSIELQVHSTRHISWNIANGQIDFAIVGGEVPCELLQNLDVTLYAEDELALILPTTHPFAKLDQIQKEDLYQLRFIALDSKSTIRQVIENVLAQHEIDTSRFNIEMELNSIEAIKNAVQSGLGAALVSLTAIEKELELKRLHWAKIEDVTIKRSLYLIVNPNRYMSNAAQVFLNEILSLFVKTSATKT